MALDPRCQAFADQFGRLVVLLRAEPANVPAQKTALRAAMTLLKAGACTVEAGVESSGFVEDLSLKGRLLARHTDTIQFGSRAPAAQVLDLARALAADDVPIPSTDLVRVEMLPVAAPPPPPPPPPATPPPVIEPAAPAVPGLVEPESPARPRTMVGPIDEADRLAAMLTRRAEEGNWIEVLHAAQALCRLAPRFPDHERRTFMLSLRRAFPRKLLERLVQFAMRVPEERPRVIEVLRMGGPEALELMVERVGEAEVLGPREFLFEALAGAPEALALVIPMLSSPQWYTVVHGTELLAGLQRPEGIEPLKGLLTHPDERVRTAAAAALGAFRESSVVIPLRRALEDPSPRIRSVAARSLARQGSSSLAMPILAALESEKDTDTWLELVDALAGIDSAEATTALVTLALDRSRLLHRGRPPGQRLEIVEALARARTAHAWKALDRLAREGDDQIRTAASRAMRDWAGGEER